MIDWSLYGGYTLEASTLGTPVPNHLAPVVASAGSKKQLSIGTYNVENLAPGPLVARFLFRGQPVTVIGNHFDAKLGDQNADGRYQYPAQASATQRAGQAKVVHDFVSQLLDVNNKAAVVVLGDLNDYQFSPSLAVLRTGSADGSGKATLSDLITTLPTD